MRNRLSIDRHQCRSFYENYLGLKCRNPKIPKISCYSLMKPARGFFLVSITRSKHFLHRMVLPQVEMRRKRSRSRVLIITGQKSVNGSTVDQSDLDAVRCSSLFSVEQRRPHVSFTSLSKVMGQTFHCLIFATDTGISSLSGHVDLELGMGEYDERVLRPR